MGFKHDPREPRPQKQKQVAPSGVERWQMYVAYMMCGAATRGRQKRAAAEAKAKADQALQAPAKAA